jgi:hypothetical protein
MPKLRKLGEATEQADWEHYLYCAGEEESVVLGTWDKFDLEDSGEYGILIQYGEVLYFDVPCEGLSLGERISRKIDNALVEAVAGIDVGEPVKCRLARSLESQPMGMLPL